jgi:hypothetical protein
MEKKNEEFDYESLWNKEDKKKEKNIVDELPKGLPRTGIKGRYLKKKQYVGRQQLKKSWGSYFKSGEGRDIVED